MHESKTRTAGVWKALLLLLAGFAPAIAGAAQAPAAGGATGRYIVELADPPVAAWRGGETRSGLRLKATAPAATGLERQPFDTPDARAYLDYLDERRNAVLNRQEVGLKRVLSPAHVYEYAFNGMALDLTAREAAALADDPGVAAVYPEFRRHLASDAGPSWVRAPGVWSGSAPGAGAGTQGEGVVIGVIDTGINAEHPSFADIGGDGYDHDNPRDRFYGLCASGGGRCNDKLIGIHDFTDEGSNGQDTDGHGSHVAGTAAGNHVSAVIRGNTTDLRASVSGVAPHANLISYKACNAASGDDEGGCPGSALMDALDRAVANDVDVINYSIGSLVNRTGPWAEAESQAMLNAREAGVVVVASAGNNGPEAGTVSLPAVAPWVIAVANATHDRRFVNRLENMEGGNAPPPMDLTGVGFTGSLASAPIVHAKDFGNRLCGTGPMDFPPTGASNPFEPGTFDGQIVVCDRGKYARVEKGYNVWKAGARGYVLANTAEQGESVVSDDHYLPAVHLGFGQSEVLRDWLEAGGDRRAAISGTEPANDPAFADVVRASSSRGPSPRVPGVMKPDLAAPGTDILAADMAENGQAVRYQFLTGTSMASPHVAGAAALVKAARPAWSAAEIHSALVMTARPGPMTDSVGGGKAGARARGAGRLDVAAAVNAGLLLHETAQRFSNADPAEGGDPSDLNLPALADHACFLVCRWDRTFEASRGGVTWRAVVDAPPGVDIRVAPEEFTLANRGETRGVSFRADVRDGPIGEWVNGSVRFEPVSGEGALPNAVQVPLNIFVSGGPVPDRVQVQAEGRGGSEFIGLDNLVALPDLTLTTSGLRRGDEQSLNLREDDTNRDPYDNFNDGTTHFELVTVTRDDSRLIAEILSSNATDIDLYVGRDTGDGEPDLREELCASTTPDVFERCELAAPAPGDYWILVQNWKASGTVNNVNLVHAVIPATGDGLTATGPSRVDVREAFDIRLSWDETAMEPGSRWYGTVLLGTDAANPGNLGVVPVVLKRGNDPALADRPLVPGRTERFHLPGDTGHPGLFVDLPPGTTKLTVTANMQGNGVLDLFAAHERRPAGETAEELRADADVAAADPGASTTLTVESQGGLKAGRWYIVPFNDAFLGRDFELSVKVQTAEGPIAPVRGMWFNPARSGHGLDVNRVGGRLFIVWFTYLEDGTPAWYLADGPFDSDIWSADLNRFTWDGERAKFTRVGEATLTFNASDEAVFSWTLHGRSGSEPMVPCVGEPSCIPGGLTTPVDRTGHWFASAEPGWGDTVVTQGDFELHTLYVYDDRGNPRWLQGVNRDRSQSAVTDLFAFEGFCPVCEFEAVDTVPAGSIETAFDGQREGQFSVNAHLPAAYPGNWVREPAGMSMISDPVDR